MLHAAGVFLGDFFVHADGDQELGQYQMTLIDFQGDGETGTGQHQVAVVVQRHISILAEALHRHADAGLAVAQMIRHIDGTHVS